MPEEFVLEAPAVFDGHCRSVEKFLLQAQLQIPDATPLIFDLHRAAFMHPYGVLALVGVALRLSRSGTPLPIRLRSMQPTVHRYLERVNVFKLEAQSQGSFCPLLVAEEPLTDMWSRNSATDNLLEISPLVDDAAVRTVESRVSQIFRAHLGDNTGHIVNVVSELCRNAHEHSGDTGLVLVQKTNAPDGSERALLRLAICDYGVGVLTSLSSRHSYLQSSAEALDGIFKKQLSSRQRGGNGLLSVAQRVGPYSGQIWMRSEDAAMECLPLTLGVQSNYAGNVDLRPYPVRMSVPGTQVSVTYLFPVA